MGKFGIFFERRPGASGPSLAVRRERRFEILENREMLSVTPGEYAAVCARYSELKFPAYEDANFIELNDLSEVALRAAYAEAAASSASDVIWAKVETESTITISGAPIDACFDSRAFGAATLVSVDARLRLELDVDDVAFELEGSTLQFGGVDFCDIDSTEDVYASRFAHALDAPAAAWRTDDVAYWDENAVDISATFANDYFVAGEIEKIQNYFQNGEILASAASQIDPARNYAVIFIGGGSASGNNYFYYETLVSLYSKLTTEIGLDPANIVILYADGDKTNTSKNRVDRDGDLTTSDLSFAVEAGSPIYSATLANLNAVMEEIGGKMNADCNLLFYTYDHGSGKKGDVDDTKDYLVAWNNGGISGANVAKALQRVKEGRVTCALTQCYSGGLADDVLDPRTGVPYLYDGNALFYCLAATNHYEESWTLPKKSGPEGFAQGVVAGLDVDVRGPELFERAYESDPFAAKDETYENNGGVSAYQIEHGWAAGVAFPVFAAARPTTRFAVELSNARPEYQETITALVTPAAASFGAQYQWFVVEDDGSTSAISGATSASIKVGDDAVGKKLLCNVVGAGEYAGTCSATTKIVANPILASVRLSVNAPIYDQTVSASTTPSSARATATYQWYRVADDGTETPIEGATNAYYKVKSSADFGYRLKVVATGGGVYIGTATATTPYAATAAPLVSLTISSDAPTLGETLSAVVEPGSAMCEYQWYRVDPA
ncbi:MAG: hypothetical protein HUK22_00755, partial [Thermoguttaceae bacterium]|nr:hypothetical protein [Thermoguttaceae bacterium]